MCPAPAYHVVGRGGGLKKYQCASANGAPRRSLSFYVRLMDSEEVVRYGIAKVRVGPTEGSTATTGPSQRLQRSRPGSHHEHRQLRRNLMPLETPRLARKPLAAAPASYFKA